MTISNDEKPQLIMEMHVIQEESFHVQEQVRPAEKIPPK
jgi:hypothetical protein